MNKINIIKVGPFTYIKINDLYYSNLKFEGKEYIIFEGKKYFLIKYEELEKRGIINKIRFPKKSKVSQKLKKS